MHLVEILWSRLQSRGWPLGGVSLPLVYFNTNFQKIRQFLLSNQNSVLRPDPVSEKLNPRFASYLVRLLP